MGSTRYVQGKDGKMAGSIGAGKGSAPVEISTSRLRTLLTVGPLATKNAITLDELHAAYLEDQAALERAHSEEIAARANAVQSIKERKAFWDNFRPEPGTLLPPTYESHEHLPIGTVVKLVGATTGTDRFWNDNMHVKTGPSSWANIGFHRHDDLRDEEVEILSLMVERRVNNISPCPTYDDGQWKIVAVIAN